MSTTCLEREQLRHQSVRYDDPVHDQCGHYESNQRWHKKAKGN